MRGGSECPGGSAAKARRMCRVIISFLRRLIHLLLGRPVAGEANGAGISSIYDECAAPRRSGSRPFDALQGTLKPDCREVGGLTSAAHRGSGGRRARQLSERRGSRGRRSDLEEQRQARAHVAGADCGGGEVGRFRASGRRSRSRITAPFAWPVLSGLPTFGASLKPIVKLGVVKALLAVQPPPSSIRHSWSAPDELERVRGLGAEAAHAADEMSGRRRPEKRRTAKIGLMPVLRPPP